MTTQTLTRVRSATLARSRSRSATLIDPRDPWEILGALRREPALDADLYVHRFLDLVARRASPLERDLLLAEGCARFGYRLGDAVRLVEARVLHAMLSA